MTDSTAPQPMKSNKHAKPDFDWLADAMQFCAPGAEAPRDLILQKGFARANRSTAVAADYALYKAWCKASHKFDASIGTLGNFFAKILTDELKSASRSERRHQNRFVPFPENLDFPDEAAEADMEWLVADMDRSALRQAMARGLRRLPKRDRKLIWLSVLKKQTYPQILERSEYRKAGLTVSACKSRAARAKAKLRRFLKQFSPRNN